MDAKVDDAAQAAAAVAAAGIPHPAIPNVICPPVGGADGSGLIIPPGRKTPRRQCRFPGCTKTIKSQGHCQKHGARAKRCKVDGCEKQAQGTHEGMCKRHWKEVHQPKPPPKASDLPPEPTGPSVYDQIIPQSIAWKAQKSKPMRGGAAQQAAQPPDPDKDVMPLVAHLRDNSHLEAGWHRTQERLSRGIKPTPTPAAQFEPWERQLVMFEIMLMAGTLHHSHRDLAHGWGREKGFHNVLVNQVCERRGEMERKKRSDTGRTFTPEQRLNFKVKLQKARSEKKARILAQEHAAQISNANQRPPVVALTTQGTNAGQVTLTPAYASPPVPVASPVVNPTTVAAATAATAPVVTPAEVKAASVKAAPAVAAPVDAAPAVTPDEPNAEEGEGQFADAENITPTEVKQEAASGKEASPTSNEGATAVGEEASSVGDKGSAEAGKVASPEGDKAVSGSATAAEDGPAELPPASIEEMVQENADAAEPANMITV